MIRRWVSLCVVGLLCASAARAQGPDPVAPSGPAPRIKFEATEVKLGDVVRGQDAVATFTYLNTGSAPLHILSAKPG